MKDLFPIANAIHSEAWISKDQVKSFEGGAELDCSEARVATIPWPGLRK